MSPYKLVCQMKPYIQPFERTLALRELEALASASPVPQESHEGNLFEITTECPPSQLASRLTYWERIFVASEIPTIDYFTRQVRREATSYFARNSTPPEQLREKVPFQDEIPLPTHRSLRYGPHGIHEYRGKFFPQLVRSLLNIVNASSDTIVLDPMCGSGTAPVEAILLGCQAIGLDINPLSVLMSQTKCDIVSLDPDLLLEQYHMLKNDLLALRPPTEDNLPWFEHLPKPDQIYLSRWFAPQVLIQLDPITVRVHKTTHPTCRALFRLCLSNILRPVSWQKDDDLRVRREKRPIPDIDVLSIFFAELDRSVKAVLAFLYENQDFQPGKALIIETDARYSRHILSGLAGRIDIIITSPPYATALPYIDTDRLSLCYLGLLPRPQHRSRERAMIGNREITTGQRQRYWKEYMQRKNELPPEITTLIDRIDRLNYKAEVGFRRRNKAALLARYFLDMREVFENFRALLRPQAPAYVVVGNNHTIAGGKRVDIETDRLLARLGEFVGLTLEEMIPMDMLTSRDIFRRNSGTTETILCFRR